MALECAKGITQISPGIRYAFLLFSFALWQFVFHLSCCLFFVTFPKALTFYHVKVALSSFFLFFFSLLSFSFSLSFSSRFSIDLPNSLICRSTLTSNRFDKLTKIDYVIRMSVCIECLELDINAILHVLLKKQTIKREGEGASAINSWGEFKITVKYDWLCPLISTRAELSS